MDDKENSPFQNLVMCTKIHPNLWGRPNESHKMRVKTDPEMRPPHPSTLNEARLRKPVLHQILVDHGPIPLAINKKFTLQQSK